MNVNDYNFHTYNRDSIMPLEMWKNIEDSGFDLSTNWSNSSFSAITRDFRKYNQYYLNDCPEMRVTAAFLTYETNYRVRSYVINETKSTMSYILAQSYDTLLDWLKDKESMEEIARNNPQAITLILKKLILGRNQTNFIPTSSRIYITELLFSEMKNFITLVKKIDWNNYEDTINKETYEGQITLKRRKDIEMSLIQSSTDNLVVLEASWFDENIKQLVCLTNNHTWHKIRNLYAEIINLIPDKEDIKISDSLKGVFEALKNNETDVWVEALQEYKKAIQKGVEEQLCTFVKDFKSKVISEEIRNLENRKNDAYERIFNLEQNIKNLYSQIKDIENNLLIEKFLKQTNEEDTTTTDLLEFFKTNKQVTLKGLNKREGTILVDFVTPLKFYDEAYAKRLVKIMLESSEKFFNNHDVSEQYREPLTKFFEDVFVNNKYTIYTYTPLKLFLMDSGRCDIRVQYESNNVNIPQPHLVRYGCFGTYKKLLEEAKNKADLTGILNIVGASSQNFNLTDSTVLGYFLNSLCTTPQKSLKSIKNNETGEFISFEDYMNKSFIENLALYFDFSKLNDNEITSVYVERILNNPKKRYAVRGLAGIKRILDGINDIGMGIHTRTSFEMLGNATEFTTDVDSALIKARIRHKISEIANAINLANACFTITANLNQNVLFIKITLSTVSIQTIKRSVGTSTWLKEQAQILDDEEYTSDTLLGPVQDVQDVQVAQTEQNNTTTEAVDF